MQQEVVIVLNEREPAKARAAETLCAKLIEREITCSRLDASQKLFEILKEGAPRVLVLDYLIGDVTTGLDLAERLNRESGLHPYILFLTDEPSVPVAVQAMKLGAINYYQLENPAAINQLAEEISTLVRKPVPTKRISKIAPTSLDSLVAQSKLSLELIARARARALTPFPIVLIQGRPGSGRSTIAQALQHERKSNSFLRSIDFDLYDGTLEELFSSAQDPHTSLSLGSNLSLILDHVEADDGTLLNYVSRHLTRFWPNIRSDKDDSNNSFLTICTSCVDTMRGWSRLTGTEPLIIPPLADRTEDIAPLVQRFTSEAHDLSGAKIKAFTSEAVLWLSKQEWHGEIRELRSVVFESALMSAYLETDVKTILQESIERWVEDHTEWERDIDPLLAARALESCSHNYRITAARLGLSVSKLRELLNVSNGGVQ